MSRTFTRAAVAIAAALALAGGTFLGAPAATAAPSPVTNVHATPMPPEKVKITWDAYTDFTVGSYRVDMVPGPYSQTVDGSTLEATFVALNWGRSYQVTVTAIEAGTGTEASSDVFQLAGRKLNAKLTKTLAMRGSKVSVTGTLLTSNNNPVAGQTVTVQYRLYPKLKYSTLKSVVTKADGSFSATFRAQQNSDFRALVSEPDTAGGWDANMVLGVKAPMSLSFSKNPVAFGRAVRYSGAFDCPPSLVAGESVRLQAKVGGSWKNIAATTASASGTYSFRRKPTSRADLLWRVVSPAGESFQNSASRAHKLTVR
jgi:Fibronectin type III domain